MGKRTIRTEKDVLAEVNRYLDYQEQAGRDLKQERVGVSRKHAGIVTAVRAKHKGDRNLPDSYFNFTAHRGATIYIIEDQS